MKTTIMSNKVYTTQDASLISRFDLTGWTREKGEILMVYAMAASSEESSTVIGASVPFDARFATELNTASWAIASGLGQWPNN